jgi:hypothetical protein
MMAGLRFSIQRAERSMSLPISLPFPDIPFGALAIKLIRAKWLSSCGLAEEKRLLGDLHGRASGSRRRVG